MKINGIWYNIQQKPVTKAQKIKIAYVTIIERIPVIITTTIESKNILSEKTWQQFCSKYKIEKWTYQQNLTDL